MDLVVTSPPYFALRSYTDGGEHYSGQIGSEPTPQEFLEALWTVTRECVRVLKPSGSIWVNLGDKYAGSRMDGSNDNGTGSTSLIGTPSIRSSGRRDGAPMPRDRSRSNVPTKSLMGLPWRYAIGCIDQLGLILRAEVIWSKPNGLPESVTDRVRRSHEQWFHFTVSPRYFSAVDEIREPQKYPDHPQLGSRHVGSKWTGDKGDGTSTRDYAERTLNLLGKLPGSVWTIPSEPLTVPDHLGIDHFAAFPTEWPRRIIQGWSPSGICVECGEGRRPESETEQRGGIDSASGKWHTARIGSNGVTRGTLGSRSTGETTITGYACACPTPDAPTRPAVVLDPFGGTGTTALCASVLGRTGVSVDLSHDYSRLARWRTTDPASRAKAMRVEKPPTQLDGQIDLFGVA